MIQDWDDHGLALGDENRRRIPWSEIDVVIAFKVDAITFDSIRLGLQAGERVIEVGEDWEQWDAFIDALPKHLPGCLSFGQWFFDVAFPAFETNATEIFRRNRQAV